MIGALRADEMLIDESPDRVLWISSAKGTMIRVGKCKIAHEGGYAKRSLKAKRRV
jgi:hypothetical protein